MSTFKIYSRFTRGNISDPKTVMRYSIKNEINALPRIIYPALTKIIYLSFIFEEIKCNFIDK